MATDMDIIEGLMRELQDMVGELPDEALFKLRLECHDTKMLLANWRHYRNFTDIVLDSAVAELGRRREKRKSERC
jgi:hypothetical protein